MNLVIVESPAKAKTIEKYLGKEFKTKATVGHIIDLPSNKLSVDTENGYKPEFAVMKGKKKVISDLKKNIPKDGKVYLAMDPDREGEAIAFHTAEALSLKNPLRVTFHEITKEAVNQSIKSPSKINMDLVNAQFARRVLDRLVGYKLSELLWRKIRYGLSAGRVQSVALRLIVEREDEIESFLPKEFWEISVDLLKDKGVVKAKLTSINGKRPRIDNGGDADLVEKEISVKEYKVVKVDRKNIKGYPYPPLTTSTLQQGGNKLFGYSSKKTMSVAQGLYQRGYITYMRTDSVSLSSQAIDSIRKGIVANYGKEYLPEKPNIYKVKSKLAQEAHEAIRPTDLTKKSNDLGLTGSDAKIYDLIYRRAVASQMNPALFEKMVVSLSPVDVKTEYIFTVEVVKTIFEGFRKVLGGRDFTKGDELEVVSDVKEGEILDLKEIIKEQKFTKPKARYTEASLVKMLEKMGVGRPSTYASIISTILDRDYVVKEERRFRPTDVGRVVCRFLKENFSRLVDYKYTANVEDSLDEIAQGRIEYPPFIDGQFKPLVDEMAIADKNVSKEDMTVLGDSDEKCPECGSQMKIKLGKYGKFLSCSKFPECKGMKSMEENKIDENRYFIPEKCDKCGKPMTLKNGKYGKFWACEDYPNCKGTLPMLLLEKCPECGSNLVERKGKWGRFFIGCSGYPKCRYIKKNSKK